MSHMLRVVLDTNVLVSGLIMLGKPRELLSIISRRETTLVLSKEILNEFSKVMRRNKFAEYAKEEQVERFIEDIESIAELTELKSNIKVVKDPKDNIVIGTAIDGEADIIVSGDHHLLSLKEFRGIKILSVDEAVHILKKM
ncbi:putative toxin-antitoxin system toxin component, PIN family [Candidatus Bathyarchaeota archaeon]|nr:putative toxin-antitoxin system toxin component, PIN family [Candidatus Bathyarchaeota archaeon]